MYMHTLPLHDIVVQFVSIHVLTTLPPPATMHGGQLTDYCTSEQTSPLAA